MPCPEIGGESMVFLKEIDRPRPDEDETNIHHLEIIVTSHDLTPNGGLVREIPLFQENPGW